jgi:hypothetical protein
MSFGLARSGYIRLREVSSGYVRLGKVILCCFRIFQVSSG